MSKSDPTHLIITLIGVVITLALLMSILYANRRHFSYFNGICNRNFKENENDYNEIHEMVNITT